MTTNNVPILYSLKALQDLFETIYEHFAKIYDPEQVFCTLTEWSQNNTNKIVEYEVEDEAMEAGLSVSWLGLNGPKDSFFTNVEDKGLLPTAHGVTMLNMHSVIKVEDFEGLEGNHNVAVIERLSQCVQVDWLGEKGDAVFTAWHPRHQLKVSS